MPKRTPVETESENNWSGIFALVIVVLMIGGVLFAMTSGGPPQVSDAEKLIAQSEIAIKGLTRESFTFEGGIETQTQAGSFSIGATGEGRIDSGNQRMFMKINLEGGLPGLGARSMEAYTIGQDVYVKFADAWTRFNSSEDLWGEAHFSQKLIEFVKEFEFDLDKKEIVNGRPTFKVVVEPTIEEFVDLIGRLEPAGFLEGVGITDLEDPETGVRDIEAVVWIDETDFLPVKATFVLKAQSQLLNPAGSGVIPLEFIVSVTLNFDYDTPFNIVLPSGALDAVLIE
jgi:hypothetical protein